jgi:hypothetical protein
MPVLILQLVAGEFAVCRLSPAGPVPSWAGSAVFSSVTRTADEVSIICPAAQVPVDVKHDAGWRLVKFHGTFAFTETGILASVVAPLAAAKIGILAVATHDTDYVLIKAAQTEEALRQLTAAGHQVRRG